MESIGGGEYSIGAEVCVGRGEDVTVFGGVVEVGVLCGEREVKADKETRRQGDKAKEQSLPAGRGKKVDRGC